MKISGRITAIALTAVACALLTSTPAAASFECGYSTYQTPTNWGFGATCQQAIDDLYIKASADIACEYGSCFEQLILTSPNGTCFFNGSQEQADGYIQYRCYVWVPNECEFKICTPEPY